MEESLDLGLYAQIKKEFEMGEVDVKTYSPLVLAFIGDGIYDLIIRSIVVSSGNRQVEKMHKAKSHYVKAASQAYMAEALLPELTPVEADVYRRGRNAKSYTSAKNASTIDYRKATGFEALCGYLYLTNQTPRLMDLIKKGMESLDGQGNNEGSK